MPLHQSRILDLGSPERVWSIAAPEGNVKGLNQLHSMLWRELRPGDRVIYHGNYLGNPSTTDNPDAIDAIQMFRAAVVDNGILDKNDIICLKGLREHLWQKLLVLHFADNPLEVLHWLLSHGMEGLLNHYGTCGQEGLAACRGGTTTLIRWLNAIRHNMYQKTGHVDFYPSLASAAAVWNENNNHANMLFVHSGIDPKRAIDAQEDAFWWLSKSFHDVPPAFAGFDKIVRGWDPDGGETLLGRHMISLSGRKNWSHIVQCAEISSLGNIKNLYSF